MDYFAEEESPQPHQPSQPAQNTPERKRKLFKSCDYCRQRRRACDAATLGIHPFIESTSNDTDRPIACTTCQKAGRVCTFEWLRSLPAHSLPQGIKNRLGIGRYTSQQGEGSDDPESLEEDASPEAQISPFGHNSPEAADEADTYVFGQAETNQEQLLNLMRHEVADDFSEHDPTLTFSSHSFDNSNTDFSPIALSNSFHTSSTSRNNEMEILTEHLGTVYSSQPQNSMTSYTVLQSTEFEEMLGWEPLSGQLDTMSVPSAQNNSPPSPNNTLFNLDSTPSNAHQSTSALYSSIATPSDRQVSSRSGSQSHSNTARSNYIDESSNLHKSSTQSQHNSSIRRRIRQLPRAGRSSLPATCKNCRVKRMPCDGRWPACTACIRSDVICEYSTKRLGETSGLPLKHQLEQLHEQLKQHTQLLEHLQSVPDSEAVTVIRRLRSTRNALSVLSSLKGSVSSSGRLSEIKIARQIVPPTESGIEFELTVQHPSVYLPLEPLDIDPIDIATIFPKFSHSLPSANRSQTSHGEPFIPILANVAQSSHSRRDNSERLLPFTGPIPDQPYCDSRLHQLNIGYWTKIPISNDLAAQTISNFLETDHPVFGCFDADLFLSDLVELRLNYCSPFLLSAIMAYACQASSPLDTRMPTFGARFMKDAEILFRAEQSVNSAINLAAETYLGMAALLCGRGEFAAHVVSQSYEMAISMNLFGIRPTDDLIARFRQLSPDRMKEAAHAAWGTYNWLSLRSFYFPNKPINFPPMLPIPGDKNRIAGTSNFFWPPHLLPDYMGETFPTFCKLWVLAQEISSVYYLEDSTPLVERVSLAFAESKFQKLLAWAETIPKQIFRDGKSANQALLFHGCYHSTILSLFRPFLNSDQSHLRSFSSTDATSYSVFSASLNQLKRTVYYYCTQQHHRKYVACWFNAPIIQVSFAIIQYRDFEPNWYLYFRLCFLYWKDMVTRYSVFHSVTQASLALALQLGAIDNATAVELIKEFRDVGKHNEAPEVASTYCVLDFDGAINNVEQSDMDHLAKQFEEQLCVTGMETETSL